MTTQPTLSQTAKLFQPKHTTVIFCADPKLPETLYWDLTQPMKNTRWCTVMPTSENNIIGEMEAWKQDHDTEWFLLDLEKIAPHYEQLANFEKFAELLLQVDTFAVTHHLKMVVAFPLSDNASAPMAAQILDAYLKYQSPKQREHFTLLTLTDQAPYELTIQTCDDDDEGSTIAYELDAQGHLTETNSAVDHEQALVDSIRHTVQQMNALAQQMTDGADHYEIGRLLGALVIQEHDEQHHLLEMVQITAKIKNEFKRHNETLDALLGAVGSPVYQGYNEYLEEHHATEKWTHHHDADDH